MDLAYRARPLPGHLSRKQSYDSRSRSEPPTAARPAGTPADSSATAMSQDNAVPPPHGLPLHVGDSVTGTQLLGEPLTGTVTRILGPHFMIVKDDEGREWLTTASRIRKTDPH